MFAPVVGLRWIPSFGMQTPKAFGLAAEKLKDNAVRSSTAHADGSFRHYDNLVKACEEGDPEGPS